MAGETVVGMRGFMGANWKCSKSEAPNVCFCHKADVAVGLTGVRFDGKSGPQRRMPAISRFMSSPRGEADVRLEARQVLG